MNTERDKRIKELREEKISYGKISKIVLEEFGETISRQRVHQITSGYKIPNCSKAMVELYTSVKVRDNYTCQRCGAKERKLTLYHKDSNASNNEPSNLLTVCKACLGHLVKYEK